MAAITKWTLTVLCISTLSRVDGFIDVYPGTSLTHCTLPSPCTCDTGRVNCESKGIQTIPAISSFANWPTSWIRFFFNDNDLTTVPPNVFVNATNANVSFIELYFQNNNIWSISDLAFSGIDTRITTLQLSNNQLTTLPAVITSLVSLQTLELKGNPLWKLDAQILMNLRRNLRTFSISLKNMTSWPAEIRVLRELQVLRIDHIPFASIPDDAFHGIETTLKTLSISYTGTSTTLNHIPSGVCHLRHLQSVSFSNNTLQDRISLNDLCHTPLTEVTSLSLDGNGIAYFPEGIFTTFPNLQYLSLARNKLRYVSSEYVPDDNQLTTLVLDYNRFCNIMAAVSSFPHLQTLHMAGNDVFSIGNNDLVGLYQLSRLYLFLNPIEHIGHHAFQDQEATLRYLDLDITHLDTIPPAVTLLRNLTTLRIDTNPSIECMCDELIHLKSWNITGREIHGFCELTHEPLMLYIIDYLPRCL